MLYPDSVIAEGLGSLRDGAGGHHCHPCHACGCFQAAVALLWVQLHWDVKAVASRWDNNTAGHLDHLSQSYSGHFDSRDCLTQGDLKLCLDPCLNPFQLCFPHNCASSSLLACLWVASRLLRAASFYSLDNFPLKPTLESLFSLLFFSLHLATAISDY